VARAVTRHFGSSFSTYRCCVAGRPDGRIRGLWALAALCSRFKNQVLQRRTKGPAWTLEQLCKYTFYSEELKKDPLAHFQHRMIDHATFQFDF
jgi:hypothetical protein